MEQLQSLFSPERYMPHGHCYLWEPGLVSVHVVSDGLIGLAYFAISASLVWLVYRSRGAIPFRSVFLAFGLFIVTCGATHLMSVWTLWNPTYWLSGGVKALTAVASVGTALILPPLVPVALRTLREARMAEARGVELEKANLDLTRLYERLKALEHQRSRFFANVSHDLRTPLTLILGPAEHLLTRPELPAEARRDVEVVVRNASVLLRHVEDLLDLARREEGELRARHARVDLARLLRRSASNFDVLSGDHDIALIVEGPQELTAEVDPEKVERIAVNLLSNAFKHTPSGGRVRLSWRAGDDDRVSFEVADSGPGIPPGDREAVFERFRQLEGSSRVGGTGLGLSIARDFAALHGGHIRIGEAPEGGALFEVTLQGRAPEGEPVRSGASMPTRWRALEPELAQGLSTPAPEQVEGERASILVVEDNPELNRFVVRTLSTAYQVRAAFDGVQALEAVEESAPDLVVTDLSMPGMGGEELVARMRACPELAGIPVLVLTARDDRALRVSLLRRGVQDWVTKPFSSEELVARVGNLVAAKRTRDVLAGELETRAVGLEGLARELASSRRELGHALEEARVARELAERGSRIKTNFLRLVSHELRTPLTALQLQISLLQRNRTDPLQGTQQPAVERMQRSCRRQNEIIETILEYARIESGRFEMRSAPFQVAPMVDELLADHGVHAQQKGVRVRRVGGEGDPELVSDPGVVRLILVNLLGNAVKFTEQGEIAVELDRIDGQQRIRVRDTGPGIAPEDQATIFEPFPMLEDLRYKQEAGSGFGLSIVREMVETLGGRIVVDSELGRGTTFTVLLPQHEER